MFDKRMRITKILNNNAVIALDCNKKEVIAIGNGLGFKHVVYDVISHDEVIKTYALVNKNMNQKLITILNEIPFDCIELTEEIITMAQQNLKNVLNENLVIALADHINFAIRRFKDGLEIPNMINEEIKRFYKEEYAIGLKALEMINQHYQIKLPNDEASSIAFHLINASEGSELNDSVKIMQGVNDILAIVETDLGTKLNEESLDYSRFIIHLKFFMKKVLFNVGFTDNSVNNVIYSELIRENELLVNCMAHIKKYIEQKYSYTPSSEDCLYLMIHIVKIKSIQ